MPDRGSTSADAPVASRPLWAETSAGAVERNYARARRAAGRDTPVLAVVKANAYGHGAAGCAPVLAAAGAPWLGVTDVAEGVEVRRALGILPQTVAPRVLVMCGVWPGDEAACLQAALTPAVWESYHLQLLQTEAVRRGLSAYSVAVHVEIDTGMARQGVTPGAALGHLLQQMGQADRLRLEGVFTHFASAESLDSAQNAQQRDVFLAALEQLSEAGVRPTLLHAGNTSALDGGILDPWLVRAAASAGATPLARAGLALYGYAAALSGADNAELHPYLADLEPALTWKTRVAGVRDVPAGATVGYNATFTAPSAMRLALLPVGYADGYRRSLSATTAQPGAHVLLHGHRAPVVGRVSMDLTVIDVTAIPAAAPRDEVVLLGTQGSATVSADALAQHMGTNAYEVLCGISSRVPRVMVD